MKLQFYTVDSFASEPFGGNPAAVVPLNERIPDELMKKIAKEFNISETAFLEPLEARDVTSSSTNPWVNDSRFRLRWMTPTIEVNLCGHATLASAFTLFHKLGNKSDVLTFVTRSGEVSAKRRSDQIVLDFPQYRSIPLTKAQDQVVAPLIQKFVGHLKVKEILMSDFAFKNVIVRLDDSYTRQEFEAIPPVDLTFLHDGSLVEGIILTLMGELHEQSTSRGLREFNFVSRYFTPWEPGYPEDPVTGSAHSSLGPYWSKELKLNDLKCRQCSERGGNLKLALKPDDRLEISGTAVAVMEGIISLP